VLLLTGRPGVGKTTVVRRVAEQLTPRPEGFYTEEVREKAPAARARRRREAPRSGAAERERAGVGPREPLEGQRRGFRAVTFGGETSLIASVDRRGPPRVGRYGVDVEAIDRLADNALSLRKGITIYIVDEIGKMECLSVRFVEATRNLLDSGRPVVATVGLRGTGFIAEVKRRPDAELWEVTRQNRDEMPTRVLDWLKR
jgi:nucleoside-triphosphatase